MAELKDVKGIGPKSLALLNKIGIYTIDDLLTHYPFRYDLLERNDLQKVGDGEKIIIDGKVESVPILMRFKAGLNNEKKLAENIIPDEIESIESLINLLHFLNNKTIDDPSAVIKNENRPPSKERKTGFNFSILFNIYITNIKYDKKNILLKI